MSSGDHVASQPADVPDAAAAPPASAATAKVEPGNGEESGTIEAHHSDESDFNQSWGPKWSQAEAGGSGPVATGFHMPPPPSNPPALAPSERRPSQPTDSSHATCSDMG